MMAFGKAFLHSGYDIRSSSTGIMVMPVTVTTTVTKELRTALRVMFERYSVTPPS
jgi:hypothetical protein